MRYLSKRAGPRILFWKIRLWPERSNQLPLTKLVRGLPFQPAFPRLGSHLLLQFADSLCQRHVHSTTTNGASNPRIRSVPTCSRLPSWLPVPWSGNVPEILRLRPWPEIPPGPLRSTSWPAKVRWYDGTVLNAQTRS